LGKGDGFWSLQNNSVNLENSVIPSKSLAHAETFPFA
jgi:hypothetical protein